MTKSTPRATGELRKEYIDEVLSREKELGHAILAKEKERVPCGTVGGVVPSRGLWVFNLERRKLAGRIVMVRRTGQIVVRSYFGNVFETTSAKLEENSYNLAETLPEGRWAVTGETQPRQLNTSELTRYDVISETSVSTTKKKTTTAKKVQTAKVLTPCLCGCGTSCKSRFLPGHDAKLKSLLRKAEKPLKLNQEQTAYLQSASWMSKELWKNAKPFQK